MICVCDKLSYLDRATAKAAARKMGKRYKGRRLRAYIGECGRWHLSSNRRNKKKP